MCIFMYICTCYTCDAKHCVSLLTATDWAEFERKQFPLRLCCAITVNKSQGQTLSKVCLDLREPPFTHGQLYVGASRVKTREDILVLTRKEHLEDDRALNKNIVYSELLRSCG